jgi:hypothetical protein
VNRRRPGGLSLSLAFARATSLPASALARPCHRARGVRAATNRSGRAACSGLRSRGTTQWSETDGTRPRTTNAQGRGGTAVSGSRTIHRTGDQVTVDRDVQSSTGAGRTGHKTYELENGRIESVQRDTTWTVRQGRSAEWREAERSGAGWAFEGEGTNLDGPGLEATGRAGRGPSWSAAEVEVHGGRYGDRDVVAFRAHPAAIDVPLPTDWAWTCAVWDRAGFVYLGVGFWFWSHNQCPARRTGSRRAPGGRLVATRG